MRPCPHLVNTQQFTRPFHMLPRFVSVHCRDVALTIVLERHIAKVQDGAENALDRAHLRSVDADGVHALLATASHIDPQTSLDAVCM